MLRLDPTAPASWYLPWAPTAIEPVVAAVPVSVTFGEAAPLVVNVFCEPSAVNCLEALQPTNGKKKGR